MHGSWHAHRWLTAALLSTAVAVPTAGPALASTAPAASSTQVALEQRPASVTIGVSRSGAVYTFSGALAPALAGVQVTIARLDDLTKRVTGVASTRTTAGGRYEIRTSLPLGLAGYYALTAPTADRQAARSRLYGLLVDVSPTVTPTVSLDVGRGPGYHLFSGAVRPGRSVPVTLARNVGGRLVGVAGTRTAANGGYVFRVPLGPGTYFFSALTGAGAGLSAGRSRTYGLVVSNGIVSAAVEQEAARQWVEAYGTRVTGVGCTTDGRGAVQLLPVGADFRCRVDGPGGQFTEGFAQVTSRRPFFTFTLLTD